VFKSDILGPANHFSDIEDLVSFERAMLEDYRLKYRIKYSNNLSQYCHIKIHTISIMNGVHVNFSDDTI